MPAAKVYSNISNVNYLKHQKYTHLVKILLLFIVLALHISLALMLLSPDNIESSKQPVFMEVLMLSVPAKANQSMIKPSLPTPPLKNTQVNSPSSIKKPPILVKKPAMIIPAVSKPILPIVTESQPLEKYEPVSQSVAPDATVVSAKSEAVAKNTGPTKPEHDTDKKSVDSGIMPLVKINPIYPVRAASHGIEGWVRIEFTIDVNGSVTDAIVVQSKPEDVFDEAALVAIEQWKFKPKIVNGAAVTQRAGQQLQFKLDH